MTFSEADICGHLRTSADLQRVPWDELNLVVSICIMFYHTAIPGGVGIGSPCECEISVVPDWQGLELFRLKSAHNLCLHEYCPRCYLSMPRASSQLIKFIDIKLIKLIKLGFFEPEMLLHVKKQVRSSSHFLEGVPCAKNRCISCPLFEEPIELQDDPGLDPVCWKALGHYLANLRFKL